MSKKIIIGLFGFGTVGKGLYQILEQKKSEEIEIRKICIKDVNKQRIINGLEINKDLFTTSAEEIFNDEEINLIVELIDDKNIAFHLLESSLQSGRPFISANKKMIAENLEQVISLQDVFNLPVLYEGAVCGSIPILKTIEDYFNNDKILSIEGIFNGTSNYILTQLSKGLTYRDALDLAIEAGFAELNPHNDVIGLDSRDKLTILIAHCFGKIMKPFEIETKGITDITKSVVDKVNAEGKKIKLIAKVFQNKLGIINAKVAPIIKERDSLLQNVDFEYNGIVIESENLGKQFLFGKGAGALPTGHAVFSDILLFKSGFRYKYDKVFQNIEEFV